MGFQSMCISFEAVYMLVYTFKNVKYTIFWKTHQNIEDSRFIVQQTFVRQSYTLMCLPERYHYTCSAA